MLPPATAAEAKQAKTVELTAHSLYLQKLTESLQGRSTPTPTTHAVALLSGDSTLPARLRRAASISIPLMPSCNPAACRSQVRQFQGVRVPSSEATRRPAGELAHRSASELDRLDGRLSPGALRAPECQAETDGPAPLRQVAAARARCHTESAARHLAAHVSHPVLAPLVAEFFRDAAEPAGMLAELL